MLGKRGPDQKRFRRHFLLLSKPDACQLYQSNRSCRFSGLFAARRELCRSNGVQIYCVRVHTRLARLMVMQSLPFSTGASFQSKAPDGYGDPEKLVTLKLAHNWSGFSTSLDPGLSISLQGALRLIVLGKRRSHPDGARGRRSGRHPAELPTALPG